MYQLLGVTEIGIIYSLVAVGIYLTFRIIDFPDLTVNGSFTTGAAITALCIGSNYPALAVTISILGGAICGIVTASLNDKLKIENLLASIIVMTALYSINIRIMGRPNVAIEIDKTLYGSLMGIEFPSIFLTSAIVLITLTLVAIFFTSDFGLGIRVAGQNSKLSLAYGFSQRQANYFVLGISNALVALAGSLFAQLQGVSDVNMGNGTIVIGLASVIIGEALCHSYNIPKAMIACFIGAMAYELLISMSLNIMDIGLKASDLYLITSLLIVITIVLRSKSLKEVK